ncbi:MAG: hypothetical protein V9G19_17975 [Tetrasphaera sp.]
MTSRVRTGTVVAPRQAMPAQASREQLADAARGYAAAVRRLGLDLDAAVAGVRAQWSHLPGE